MNMAGKELVREILKTESPDEAFAVDFYEPSQTTKVNHTAKGPLGIGIEMTLVAAALPVIWKVIDELTSEVRKETSKALGTLTKFYWEKKISNELKNSTNELEVLISNALIEEGLQLDKIPSMAKTIAEKIVKNGE